jgi:hypothetical protein
MKNDHPWDIGDIEKLAAKWFYRGFEYRWHDWMGGGYGNNDEGYFLCATRLLIEADCSKTRIAKIKDAQEHKFKEWERKERRKFV